MSILHLTLKRKWFDMVASGEKKEEYREIKPYWNKRIWYKRHNAITFRNGYSKDSPRVTVHLIAVTRGIGKKEWGAPEYPVYILHLGEIIKEG